MEIERIAEYEQGRVELIKYLNNGKIDMGYKEGDIPTVNSWIVRDLGLKAGYTEYVLGALYYDGSTDLVQSKRYPQGNEGRFRASLYSQNRYGINPGHYEGIRATKLLVDFIDPDKEDGKDHIRDKIMFDLRELEVVKDKLWQSGRKWFGLGLWGMDLRGNIRFSLNPLNQRIFNGGRFSINELKGWLNNDPDSPIIKKPHEEAERTHKPFNGKAFKDYYEGELKFLLESRKKAEDSDTQNRLFSIALMRCPHPDLVEKYEHELVFNE